MQKKALAGTDIEDAITRFQTIMCRHRIGDLAPAPVITIAAIARQAIAIPIIMAELYGLLGDDRLVHLGDALDIVALGGFMHQGYEIDFRHRSTTLRVDENIAPVRAAGRLFPDSAGISQLCRVRRIAFVPHPPPQRD